MNRPAIPSTASDLELLRRFEPVVRFTRGEQFFPANVAEYVRRCSLWMHYPDGRDELLVPEGELSPEKLIQPCSAPFGTVQYLRLVPPLSLEESARALAARDRRRRGTGPASGEVFHEGQGRLARGGLLPRLADALFSLTLLLRGRVPGAVAASAELKYAAATQEKQEYVYYGRVVRTSSWTALQYWFFYWYNNWRSGFRGVNDHESDWEMVLVYLYEQDGQLVPEWAGYASHDFHGDDLRRHWSDREELDLVDGHPLVYAGAGSHASYFRPGEYQAEVGLPLPRQVVRLVQGLANFWTRTLGQAGGRGGNPFRIPFVDYARGDGRGVGPGHPLAWTPVLIDEATPWVGKYRGLWGLFARDPISGENAPAGPMYNRDGSPRGSWVDPLGFAGLNKVPPPPVEQRLLAERRAELERRQAELATEIPTTTAQAQQLGSELRAMQDQPHLARRYAALEKQVDELAGQASSLLREEYQNALLLESLAQRTSELQAGRPENPRAHIRHLARPVSLAQVRFNRLIEAWAALSISVLLLGFVALILFEAQYLWLGVGLLVFVFIIFESILRGTFVSTVNGLGVVLAVVSALLLLWHFFVPIMVGGLIAASAYLLVQKLRELRA